jgi:hypothetical protein
LLQIDRTALGRLDHRRRAKARIGKRRGKGRSQDSPHRKELRQVRAPLRTAARRRAIVDSGDFYLSFVFFIDAGCMQVEFKDGVLEITVPKPKEETEKRDETVLQIK